MGGDDIDDNPNNLLAKRLLRECVLRKSKFLGDGASTHGLRGIVISLLLRDKPSLLLLLFLSNLFTTQFEDNIAKNQSDSSEITLLGFSLKNHAQILSLLAVAESQHRCVTLLYISP